jgi:sulfur-oxidizing protein SoxZ
LRRLNDQERKAMTVNTRLRVPTEAKRGEIVQIKTLASHPMETGLRKDESGKSIPREIIKSFVCEFNGRLLFSADLEPAIATNPYFEFTARMEESGTFTFTWTEDDGSVTTAQANITVS